jgi:3-phytase
MVIVTTALRSSAIILSLSLAACDGGDGSAASQRPADIALVEEVFETPRDTVDNIDSPAVWHGRAGQHWLLATAKDTDVIVVSDGATGEVLQRVGGTGTAPGQFDRPNGIAVIDDLMFVVERDNARVQVFTIPDFQSVGVYGSGDLRLPYGIAIVPQGASAYGTYITDNYELLDDVVPPDSVLGERVRLYHVTVSKGALRAELAHTFGDTSGSGVLRVVESIAVDPNNQRLLIAEEQEGASMIKVYGMDGRFTGQIIDSRYFPYQAEGIVLYTCPDGAGYWITTDQSLIANTFHVFDRTSLAHLGSFRGRTVLNTDGIALTQVPFGSFDTGAFYAVHNDGNVAAFRLGDIASALRLRSDCVARAAS